MDYMQKGNMRVVEVHVKGNKQADSGARTR